jgi:hypothetical protein
MLSLTNRIRPKRRWQAFQERRYRQIIKTKVITLTPNSPASKGNVLLYHVIDPFLLKPGVPIANSHTRFWEAWQISQIFLELGYTVDVVSYFNTTFKPSKPYAFLIDIRFNLERLVPFLNPDCIKILNIETAHILFHNWAEAQRLLALQQRRHITLLPRRYEPPTQAFEYADCATCFGNDFTLSTYRFLPKKIYSLPIPSVLSYPWPVHKDFEACRRHFLFFSSGGLVHKGLDLALEAFSGMPDFHLSVCVPLKIERDFEQAYHKELYETPNIHTIGFMDVESPEFIALANQCLGMISLSCSEGGGGAMITCMHAGLIPIANYESSVDMDNFGVLLADCQISTIQQAIQQLSDLPTSELVQRAGQAWEKAQKTYTRDRFTESYREMIQTLEKQPNFS